MQTAKITEADKETSDSINKQITFSLLRNKNQDKYCSQCQFLYL